MKKNNLNHWSRQMAILYLAGLVVGNVYATPASDLKQPNLPFVSAS